MKLKNLQKKQQAFRQGRLPANPRKENDKQPSKIAKSA
jgi:hypothetical protein